MIDEGLVPRSAEMFDAANCQTCRLTNPRRRPVPCHAERSRQVTVQVDFMPIGQEYRGLNGEVGAYVYSSRYSKVVESYPVRSASARKPPNHWKSTVLVFYHFWAKTLIVFKRTQGPSSCQRSGRKHADRRM